MKIYILTLLFLCLSSWAQDSQETNEEVNESLTNIVNEIILREHGQTEVQRRAVIVMDQTSQTDEPIPEPEPVSEITEPIDSFVESVVHVVLEEVSEPVRDKKADIVFILDNSKSMRNLLQEMDQKFESFLSSLGEDLDWQIGFIDSDVNDQILFNLEYENQILNQKILTKDIDSFEDIFIDTLTRNEVDPCDFPPYCGSFRERPLRALKQFLESDEMLDFSREESILIAIIITDNYETPQRNQNLIHPSEILNSEPINNIEEIIVYSISVVYEQCAQQIRSEQPLFLKEGRKAVLASELSDQTRGIVLDLCADSYGELAKEINKQLM